MIGGPLRCYGTAKYWNGILTANPHLGQVIVALGRQQTRAYSKKLDIPKCCVPDPKKKKREEPMPTCCKDTNQLEGRTLSEWPTSELPPPAWRCECPYDPQPPNYDPYRIRVPEVVVPPMPASNVKRAGWVMYERPDQGSPTSYGWQGQGQGQCGDQEQKDDEKDEGFLGVLKNLFGMGKKKGGEQNQMIALSSVAVGA